MLDMGYMPATGKMEDIENSVSDTADFSKITYQELSSQFADAVVSIEIGEVEKKKVKIKIPAPSQEDKEWVNKIETLSREKRSKEILVAIEAKNIWRVAAVCTIYNEQDSNFNWFNPNQVVRSGDDKSFLTAACANGNPEIVALLLGCDQVDVNKTGGDRIYWTPLEAAIHNSEHSLEVTEMLCLYKLKYSGNYYKTAKTKTIRNLLEKIYDRDFPADKERSKKSQIMEDGAVWKKLDDKTICKLSSDGNDFRLRKVFDFNASCVTQSFEYLNSDGNIIHATTPVKIERLQATELKQAQAILKKMNSSI